MRGEVACSTTVPPIRQRSPQVQALGRQVLPELAGRQLVPQFPLPPVQVLAGVRVHGLVRAAVMLGGTDDVTGQAVRPRVTRPLGARVADRYRPADRVLADAGPAGVMRRGQGLGREVD